MVVRVSAVCWLSSMVLMGACQLAVGAEPLLTTDFEKSPLAQGWELRAFGDQAFDGAWITAAAAEKPDNHCLVVRRGYWQSPAVKVKPFRYYRVSYSAKAAGDGLVSAVFFDAEGKELAADNYDTVYAAADWQSQSVCFRAHALAARVRVRFQFDQQPLHVDDVSIEPIKTDAAADWAEHLSAVCPRLRFEASKHRWKRLPRTMETLRDGGKLRIVMLGDSIINDTSNSLFETLLKRVYPKARIEVVTSVRGGTGCQYYRDENRVEEYVLRFEPQLVIIGGISHGFDVEAMRSVIRQIRAKSECEILVLTGPVCPDNLTTGSYLRLTRLPMAQALENVEKFTARVRRMAAAEKVEFFDIRTAWDQYIVQAMKPYEWFLRDPVHANGRGKQVVARILLRYFEPKESEREEP